MFCSVLLEESFAALIGIIFVYEAFDKMIEVNQHRPVRLHTTDALPKNCSCRSATGPVYWKSTMSINVRIRKLTFSFCLYSNLIGRTVFKIARTISMVVIVLIQAKFMFLMYFSSQLSYSLQHLS